MGRRKSDSVLGKSIIKERIAGQRRHVVDKDLWLHSAELDDGHDNGASNKLKSVTEQNSLVEFLATAELAGTEFTAEKLNMRFVSKAQMTGVISVQEQADILKTQNEHRQYLSIPRRPPWDSSTTPAQLEELEKQSFLDWRRNIARLQENDKLIMTPFERNLDFWRQLWRVIERSDVVVQIVDARNPLLFRCEDLEAYVKEMSPSKENVLVINKADLLTLTQRKIWADYFKMVGVRAVFWSAATETVQQKNTTQNHSSSESSSEEENDPHDGDDERIDEKTIPLEKLHDSQTETKSNDNISIQPEEETIIEKSKSEIVETIENSSSDNLSIESFSNEDKESTDSETDKLYEYELLQNNVDSCGEEDDSNTAPSTESTEVTLNLNFADFNTAFPTAEQTVEILSENNLGDTIDIEKSIGVSTTEYSTTPDDESESLESTQSSENESVGDTIESKKVIVQQQHSHSDADSDDKQCLLIDDTDGEDGQTADTSPVSTDLISSAVENSSEILNRTELLMYLSSLTKNTHSYNTYITIGLVGYPNVGKSSTINALMSEKKTPVSATPGRTKHFQTLFVQPDLCLCDCPGLVFPTFVTTKADMVVNGILPIDQLIKHIPPVTLVCQRIPRYVLERVYGVMIKPPQEGEDPTRPPTAEELLNAYGYMRGFMTSRGMPDLPRSARCILKDYVCGKLVYCQAPPSATDGESLFSEDSIYATTSLSDFNKESSSLSLIKCPMKQKPQGCVVVRSKVDRDFFNGVNMQACSMIVREKAGVNPVRTGLSEGAVGDVQGTGKPWKKHYNKNKREKTRRVVKNIK